MSKKVRNGHVFSKMDYLGLIITRRPLPLIRVFEGACTPAAVHSQREKVVAQTGVGVLKWKTPSGSWRNCVFPAKFGAGECLSYDVFRGSKLHGESKCRKAGLRGSPCSFFHSSFHFCLIEPSPPKAELDLIVFHPYLTEHRVFSMIALGSLLLVPAVASVCTTSNSSNNCCR